MNQDQLEGKWDQLKGNVRENFGELTDDDVEQVKGKRENLVGKLKERYGDTKEQAEKKIDEFLSRF
jgi:uncharacterized protein YjbJ (UPF0337 family)